VAGEENPALFCRSIADSKKFCIFCLPIFPFFRILVPFWQFLAPI